MVTAGVLEFFFEQGFGHCVGAIFVAYLVTTTCHHHDGAAFDKAHIQAFAELLALACNTPKYKPVSLKSP